jgi:hypothetical protein
MDPAFHYHSARQSELWWEVHRSHAPFFANPEFRLIFERLAAGLALELAGERLHVIGLGAGGGSKEAMVLKALHSAGCALRYTPVDASLELALSSAEAGLPFAREGVFPVAADLRILEEPADTLGEAEVRRVYTAFGIAPNLLPSRLFGWLSMVLRPGDILLLSANMAPLSAEEADFPEAEPSAAYCRACECVLAQYDNPETHAWLRQVLADWGLNHRLGELSFSLETQESVLGVCASSPWLVDAEFSFEGAPIRVREGDRFGVFFSLRYTLPRLSAALASHGLLLGTGFQTSCAQEGVWRVAPLAG